MSEDANPTVTLENALMRDQGGIVVVYYPDLGLREFLADEVESLAMSDEAPLRTDNVADAIAHPNRLALVLADDEKHAVEELEGLREHTLDPPRTRPIVLFLLRDGDGQHALVHNPGAASFLRGSDPDPERLAEIDVEAEREDFEKEAGCSPEEWLAKWEARSVPSDARSFSLTYRARLLVAP